ncbi:type IIB restriction/modification system, restriction/methyltransferase subunit [Arcobacter venerupis]|uniref:Type IIB restriction/modification system, restriction/methyltransferase subunit n=1 Tax=Arcobacter venerupis TaxID=1054033 RepID=A0AAE7BC09_9BACT|nr:N-6 DNA methylase [Arcobacter venerupis]QKF67815.1 type IIB restriction/modification system, restriction/methyltransferase subunit [Arcobacter venerupis]RWS49423.1 DNA methyltransferase [Arcobacter venerupis]
MNYDKLFETDDIVIEDEKTGKKTIKTILSPKYKDSTKKQIFSAIRNKYLDTQPEEIVRQEFICKLINEYGYSLSQMDEEVKLTTSQRGTGRASADIVVWKNEEEKKKKKTAFLVVELKADTLRLKVEDCYQGYNYATWSRAKLFAISNGKELQVYKTVEEELPLKLQPVNDIPHIDTIQDDKKLEESLAKTKEFTGDEFAKLLHKCHNIIRNNDKLSPEASFDEISKILFIKIMYERNPKQESIFSLKQFEKQKEAWNMVRGASETETSYIQRLFEDVKKEFLTDNIFDENEKIKLRERSFEQIVKELEIYNLTSTSADVKGIAFERFLGRTFRGELGQFFTPRVLVDFIVDLLEPKENELICDPCAGSGGFLIKTFESIKKTMDNYYIELKKAKQKEIFGQELENIDDEELNKQYEVFLTTVNAEQEEKIRKLSHESIFGTDANPRMARVSKMNMIMHGDGHNGIHHNDGLLNVNGIFHNRFDVIVTNPPFGTNLDKKYPLVEQDSKYTNPTIIDNYVNKYSKELFVRAGYTETYDKEKHLDIVKEQYLKEMSQVTDNIDEPIRNLFKVGRDLGSGATEVLFIERCLDLLKPGGRMGIVLPEGVLNSSNLSNAREYFESRAKILLIVSMPQDIFISSGATVKTSLVFLKKFTQEEAREYETNKKEVTKDIKAKYVKDIDSIKKVLKLRGKEALSAIDKKIKNAELKELETKRENEIKEIIKQKFDYEIPISDIKKAGITTTGAETDNELIELLKIYTEYRKTNKLWN